MLQTVREGRIVDGPGAEGLHLDAHGAREPDRVAQLDLALRGESGGDDVLGRVARRIRADPVDTQRVLAAERVATVARVLAVGVDGVLSPRETGVHRRAAAHERALRVDEDARLGVGPHGFLGENGRDDRVDQVAPELLGTRAARFSLARHQRDAVDTLRLAVAILDADLRFPIG